MKNGRQFVYKDMSSPVGRIRLVASPVGLAAILWEGEDHQRTKLPVAVPDDRAPVLLEAEKGGRRRLE